MKTVSNYEFTYIIAAAEVAAGIFGTDVSLGWDDKHADAVVFNVVYQGYAHLTAEDAVKMADLLSRAAEAAQRLTEEEIRIDYSINDIDEWGRKFHELKRGQRN